MPVKKPGKKITRKAEPDRKKVQQILFDQVQVIPVDDPRLRPHPMNPNEGDVDLIAESLGENGMFKPVVVNRRTGYIIAGTHTWLAARQEGWEQVAVVEVDVSKQRELKIMAADNMVGDKRKGYNTRLMGEIIGALGGNVTGTGMTALEAEEWSAKAAQMAAEAMERMPTQKDMDDIASDLVARSRGGGTLDDGQEYGDIEDGEVGSDDSEYIGDGPKDKGIEGVADELVGAFQLKEDMAFDGVGRWGIPRIRIDGSTLATFEDLHPKLETWAGSATKDWPDTDVHWLYNVGIDSLSGMRRDANGLFSHVTIGFYCHDDYFDSFWWNPAKKTTQLLNSRITQIVMPDFSMHTPGEESRVLSLWSLYRSRWLARYFQEAGLKLIPEVTWAAGDEDFLTKYVLATMPKKIPLLCIQVQTIDADSPLYADYIRQLQLTLDTIQPKDLLIYHGKQGKELFDNGQVKFNGRIKFLQSRLYRLGDQAKQKKRKKTL